MSLFVCCSQVCVCVSRITLLFFFPPPPLVCSVVAVVAGWRRTRWPWQEMLEQRDRWVVMLWGTFVLPVACPAPVQHYFSDSTPWTPPFSTTTESSSILHLILTGWSLYFLLSHQIVVTTIVHLLVALDLFKLLFVWEKRNYTTQPESFRSGLFFSVFVLTLWCDGLNLNS